MPVINVGNVVFRLFFLSCIPAYFLSVLWVKLPLWLYLLVVAAAVAQVIAWIKLLRSVDWRIRSKDKSMRWGYVILVIVATAVTIKLALQLGSTVPAISKLAFGFRAIVIAYLHLILLAIISVFLVVYIYLNGFLAKSRLTFRAILMFVIGVYLNELVLGIQGVGSFSYTAIPYASEVLFAIALIIFLSLCALFFSQLKIYSAPLQNETI